MTAESRSRRRQRSYIYVPPSVETAERHVREALACRLRTMGKREFLRAYWSIAYLYPGFHPDCWENWDGPRDFAPLVEEAWHRADAGELNDNELYPYQAAKARIAHAWSEAVLGRPA